MKDFVPKESETIAARRSARIAEKIKTAKSRFSGGKAWWSDGPLEIVGLIILLIFNFYLIYPVFGTAAVETTFSGPLIPFVAKLIGYSGIPEIYGVQIVNIVFHIFFPLTYYLYIRKISERKIIAFLATLLISVPFWLFNRSRIEYSLLGIESPHVSSLTMIPLALLGLLSFIREGGVGHLITTSISGALVALISPFGFFTYLIFAVITIFSEILLGHARQKIFRFVSAMITTAAFCSFWYDPIYFFNLVFGPQGEEIRSTVTKLIPVSLFLGPALATFGYLLFDRKPDLQPIFLASFYTIAFATIFIAGKGIFPSHPGRYAPELGIALSFLLSYVIFTLLEKVVHSKLFESFSLNGFFTTLITIFISTTIIIVSFFLRDRIYQKDTQVLGFSTSLPKGEIWLVKNRFAGTSPLLGYFITGSNIVFLTSLAIVSKKKKFDTQ